MPSLRIVEPAKGCVTRGNLLQLEIETCEVPFVDYTYEVYVDDVKIPIIWGDSPWKDRKFSCLPHALHVGSHEMKVSRFSRFCREDAVTSFWISENSLGIREMGAKLIEFIKRNNPPHELGWGWGEGLFLEGCVRMERFTHYDSSYVSKYVVDYHDSWWKKGTPTIDKSDSCSPGLSAASLFEMGDKSGFSSLKKISSYIENTSRNSLGTLNHLGSSYSNWFYPRSIWVDSLMMYGVLAVRWGAKSGNDKLLNFGIDQVEIFADKLQDPTVGLWRHAWLERFNHTVPETETYWLRGNGWVLASIAEMLDHVPYDSPSGKKLLEIFMRTLEGLLLLQQGNGLWDSVANIPGYTFPETSGSLLVGYAITRGIRRGWLNAKYFHIAERITNCISSRIMQNKEYPFTVTLPGISEPTNPAPRFVYGMMNEEANALYGVGIYLMLCAEMLELESERMR